MAAMVWHGTSALSLDRALQRAIGVPDWTQRSSQHLGDRAAQLASAPPLVLASLGLAVAVWRRRGRDWWALALCGISVPVGVLVEVVLKPLVGRRYFGTAYRFPSGHTAAITAVVIMALLLLAPRAAPKATWWVGVATGLAAMLAVTWGVLVTRAHSPIDAVAGIVLGAGLAVAMTAAVDGVRRRISRTGIASAEGNVPLNSIPQ
jgi:membrane-associated phospholipid phosphatase